MGKEIVGAVNVVSQELNVPEEMIFEAMESALEAATKRMFHGDEAEQMQVRVIIARDSGEYETFRRWCVVDPDTLEDEDEEPRELQPSWELTFEQAQQKNAQLQLGDWHEEGIANARFGRIEAQSAKQVIKQKIRDAEKSKIAERYNPKIGHLMSGTVKKITRDNVILEMSDNAEAILPRHKLIGREIFHVGNVVRAILEQVDPDAHGPILQMSRSCVDMMTELFKIEVPEISEHVIELRAAAREPGQRAKIAVKTNDGRIDPVGACVGIRGLRVNAVARELNDEKIDILLWDNDPEKLVENAMSPAEIENIEMDEEKGIMKIVVPEQFLAQAIGRGGQNVRLTSILSGWDINVVSSEDYNKGKQHDKEIFTDVLDISAEKAEKLIEQGIDSMETLAYLGEDSLRDVEGVSVEEMKALQEQASDALLIQVLSGKEESDSFDESFMSLPGVDEKLVAQLAEHEVNSLGELADLAVDELLEMEIPQLKEEFAGELIMNARDARDAMEDQAAAAQEENQNS